MKILLIPIAFLYHIILSIRHKLYDWRILKSKRFDMPVICVGNLALGGTGKTPHIEYLIDLLSEQYRVCVVSRGYGRKTKGFQLANSGCASETVGDEPLQYVNKFSNIMVAVDENRNEAIELMGTIDRPPELYLLDDAFQHRSTQAGLNILLTSFNKLYSNDFLVPAGTLRDVREASKRADIIVVSKAPTNLDEDQKAEIIKQLKPLPHQEVFFSSLEYEPLKAINAKADELYLEQVKATMLFCGIANPKPLINELSSHYQQLEAVTFSDHHTYTDSEINTLIKRFEQIPSDRKIMVTTEKDFARLINSPYLCKFESVPLFVVPISISIHQQEKFDKIILDYVRKNAHHG